MAFSRPTYVAFIDWIAVNDNAYWLDDVEPTPCSTAIMVADLFQEPIDAVVGDIRRAVERRALCSNPAN